MRTTSDGFSAADGRYHARLVLPDGTEVSSEDIRFLTVTASLNGSSERLTLGAAPATTLSAVVTTSERLLDRQMQLWIGRLVDGALEEVPVGSFTITAAEVGEDSTSLTGYDAMYTAMETAYYPTVEGETTAASVLADIAQAAGLELVLPEDVEDVTVEGVSTGYTLREMAGYMAALLGCSVRIDGAGALEAAWFSACGLTADRDSTYAGEVSLDTEDWTLGKLTCSVTTTDTVSDTDSEGNTTMTSTDETTVLVSGDGSTGISLADPWMRQEILDGVFARIGGLTFRGGSVSLLGDLRIEPGDVIEVEDAAGERHAFPVMSQTLEYDGGLKMTLSAYTSSESSGDATSGPLTQAVERFAAQLAVIKQLEAKNLTAVTAKISKLTATVAEIEKAYITEADIETLLVDKAYITSAEVDTLLADYIKTDSLSAEIAELGYLTAGSAAITDLTATVAEIEKAYITEADIETLLADKAYITSAEVDTLLADYIKTDSLSAEIAELGYLTAGSAIITTLSADVANINNVLAGNIGTGSLQTVHLTADNTVIDEAVITDAMIADLSASKLTAGTIYTSQVTIQTAQGDTSSLFTGSLLQFSDENTVRIQMGKDADGEFNIYICNAAGNVTWDALGLTEAGLTGNGAIVKDAAVADDAAISGSKLDIASVASCLNEDGSLTVDYSRVQIGETTLSAWYTTVNTKTDDLTTTTQTLQTGLETIQGQIAAKVWQTDIDSAVDELDGEISALSDQYSALDLTVDGITAEVGNLTTTVNGGTTTDEDGNEVEVVGLSELVADVTLKADEISTTVSSTTARIETVEAAVDEQSGELSELTESVTTQIETLQTQIEQTADSISLTISGMMSSISETTDGLQSQLDEYATYFTFTDQGLAISESDSPFAVLLGTTQLSFTESDEVVAYISNTSMYITNAEITNTLRIGSFVWRSHGSGNMGLVYSPAEEG